MKFSVCEPGSDTPRPPSRHGAHRLRPRAEEAAGFSEPGVLVGCGETRVLLLASGTPLHLRRRGGRGPCPARALGSGARHSHRDRVPGHRSGSPSHRPRSARLHLRAAGRDPLQHLYRPVPGGQSVRIRRQCCGRNRGSHPRPHGQCHFEPRIRIPAHGADLSARADQGDRDEPLVRLGAPEPRRTSPVWGCRM